MRFGREVVRRDPLGEAGYRQLMLVRDAAGDRAGAMRVYHECVTILRSELGVEPAAATPDV
jgi:DNA-binding SARP family transcriptional activator